MIKGIAVCIMIIDCLACALCQNGYQKLYKNDPFHFTPLINAVVLINLLNIISLISPAKAISKTVYSIYAALVGWFVFLLLMFYLYYMEVGRANIRRFYILIPILACTSVSNVLNLFFEHEFIYLYVPTMSGEKVLSFKSYWPHLMYETFCVLIACCALGAMIYKIYTSGDFIRVRYMMLSTSLLLLGIGEITYLFGSTAIDFTPFIFSLVIVSIYLISIVYAKKEVMRRSLSRVSQEMKELLVIFDEKDQCTFINDSAKRLIGEVGCSKEGLEAHLQEWFDKNGEDRHKDCTDDSFSMECEGKKYYFKLAYKGFWDEHIYKSNLKKYMGGYFILLDQTEEIKIKEKEKYTETHDVLTGLYNMKKFEEEVKKILYQDPDTSYLLMCSDIKEFKLINETYGVKVGDSLLIRIADRLRECARPEWVFCRMGNDRFALLLPKKNHDESVLRRMIAPVEYLEEDETYTVHIYIGFYEIQSRSMSVSAMCDRAYRAIAMIKGTYQKFSYYDESMHKRAKEAQWMVDQLPNAIANKDIVPFLQAQTDGDGNVKGAEVLVRWNHPEKGLISPGQFIPLFEENGMIATVDRYIWREACGILKTWEANNWKKISLSVNISPKDIYYMDIYNELTGLIEEFELSPEQLKLEITETAIAKDFARQMDVVHRLREYGFIVEMDDFGCGYSSLNVLKDIDIDVIKLDMAFLRKAQNGERAKTIIQMVVELAKKINIRIIVEGVETKEQKEFLEDIGCETFQGYYFAKPVNLNDFENEYMCE